MVSYEKAIEWIAENDETAEINPEELQSLISVVMVADLWNKLPFKVANDVAKKRLKDG